MATSIVRSINFCHVAIADACVMYSVMVADGSDVAAIAAMPPYMVVATIITVVIIAVIVIAVAIITIAIEPVARITRRTK